MTEETPESLMVARLIDARCDEFERALASEVPPSIEAYLSTVPPDVRPELLRELLGLEVDFRKAQRDHPVVADYAARFPEFLAEELATILHAPPPGADALIGRKLHVYQCVSLVGAGAMGKVYLALHDDLQRHCALKILSPRRGTCDADYIARFHLEGQAAAALIHPNIVTLHAVGHVAGTHFLEMEYIPGRSLQQLIREEGPLPADRALQLATMVADGLAAAHRAGIVHRDVKPDNILVTRDGTAKIGDFGLARRVLRAANEGFGTEVSGTPNYMAPELFQGRPATPASDVYALGLTLFQMLTGGLPWRNGSLTELVQLGRTETVPSVLTHRPELSLEVAECVALMTAAQPHQRPTDAAGASVLLHAVLGQERDVESLLIEAFQNNPAVRWTRLGDRYNVVRQLPGDRCQTVIIEPNQDSFETRLLLLYSICCTADHSYYEQALRLNSVMMHGSLAIREIDGQPMFVVSNAYPRSTVAPEEIRRSVIEIADQADQVEQQLTGKDRH